MAHLCGLCLALRDGHGQLARTATNYDGLIVSVLVEAQTPARAGDRRTAGPCPLRGLRTAPVARGEGARLAAAVSLALASAKMRDHVEDRDGLFARRPVAVAAGGVAERWRRQSESAGAGLGFDTAQLFAGLERQAEVEAAAFAGSSVLLVTAPTEEATALALEHTAVLAGRPGNRAALHEVGRYFGRLAHLLDAVEDLAEDQANGSWNPLVATGTSLAEAQRLCQDALHGIRLALADVEFEDRALVHRLLHHETEAAIRRVFGHTGHADHTGHTGHTGHGTVGHARDGAALAGPGGHGLPGVVAFGPPPPMGPNPFGHLPPAPPAPRRGPLAGCAMWTLLCCTCQACCREDYQDPCTGRRRKGPCSDCDCGDCDCGGCDCGGCDCDCCDGADCSGCDCDCGGCDCGC